MTAVVTEDPGATASPDAPRARRPDPRWFLVALPYFVAARALYWQFGWIPRGQIPLSPSSDQVQQVWYFAWMAHAVSHLQNPFFTTAMNYPHGINLVTNTATPLLGVLFAPLTWLAGPIATYVILLELGFALSALSAAVCARRLGVGWWRAFFIGAVYGFCAHRMVEGSIHVFLAFDVIMPWVFFAAIRFWQQRWSPRRFAITAGVLLALDFLISTERVGLEAFGLVVVVILDMVHHRSAARVREIVVGYGGALLTFLVLASVPLWYFLWGPQSIHGQPHVLVTGNNITIAQLVEPGPYAWFAPIGHNSLGSSILQGPWNGTVYLGLPLLILAVAGVVREWREPLTRGVALLTAWFLLLCLGPSISLPWVGLSIWSPERLVAKLPIVQDILPFRYMEIAVLGLAWLAARALGGLDLRALVRTPRDARSTVVGAIAVVLVALTLLSMVPNQTLAAVNSSTTPFVTTSAAQSELPEGAPTLTFPYPETILNSALLDQATSGLWYDEIGGQAIVPGPNGRNSGVTPLPPTVVFSVLYRATLKDPNGPVTGFPFQVAPLPPLDARTVQLFQRFVSLNHVRVVFWRWWGYHPLIAYRYLAAAFGPPTDTYGRGTSMVAIWERPR